MNHLISYGNKSFIITKFTDTNLRIYSNSYLQRYIELNRKIKIDNTCISDLTITFYKLFSKSTFIALSEGMKIFKITSYLSSSLCV